MSELEKPKLITLRNISDRLFESLQYIDQEHPTLATNTRRVEYAVNSYPSQRVLIKEMRAEIEKLENELREYRVTVALYLNAFDTLRQLKTNDDL